MLELSQESALRRIAVYRPALPVAVFLLRFMRLVSDMPFYSHIQMGNSHKVCLPLLKNSAKLKADHLAFVQEGISIVCLGSVLVLMFCLFFPASGHDRPRRLREVSHSNYSVWAC